MIRRKTRPTGVIVGAVLLLIGIAVATGRGLAETSGDPSISGNAQGGLSRRLTARRRPEDQSLRRPVDQGRWWRRRLVHVQLGAECANWFLEFIDSEV